jgi:PadR family transcriptional regulator, regulatory protein PadR
MTMFDGRRIQAQLLKGTLPLLVLATLRDGELHGYEIARRIRARGGDSFSLSEGSLYPALHRLETDGALEASWREGEAGPRRRYYRLTSAGHAALKRAEQDWSTFSSGVAQVALGGNQHG